MRDGVPVTFTAAKKGRGKLPPQPVAIERQRCQRLKGKQIVKGYLGCKSGTGWLKGKGDTETRLRRKQLQKAKLRRQLLLCASARQLRKKTCPNIGFLSCLLLEKDGSSSLHRVNTNTQDRRWRALITTSAFVLESS